MNYKNPLIILQARTSSKRLPGKVLKKINGIPLVVICAKRLSNKGADLVVATSKEKSDDKLIKILVKYKIKYYRGSLSNVLSRYQYLAKKLKKNNHIIRATADNPFPDGEMVKIIQEHARNLNTDYYGINHQTHYLPKGVGIEIFTAKKILSLISNIKKNEKEHVTLAIYKNNLRYLNQKLIKKIIPSRNMNKFSVSIDEKKDYQLVKKIFSKFKDPINVSYKTLLKTIK